MPFIVSEQMEKLVLVNFQILDSFERDIKSFRTQKDSRNSVEESLLKRLEVMISKVFIS